MHHPSLFALSQLPLIALYLACADEGFELFWNWRNRRVELRPLAGAAS